MWLRAILQRGSLLQPRITCTHPPPLPSLPFLSLPPQEASKNPERVELRGIPGNNARAARERPPESENPPPSAFPNPPQGSSREQSRSSVAVEVEAGGRGVGGGGGGGAGRGVTYGIWCVWIRFCSWLQQWDDSSDEWFFHICASKAKRGADVIRFISRKKKKKKN